MKPNYKIDQKLLSHIDAMNTVGGGMAAPQLNYQKEKEGYMLTVGVPGTSVGNLQAEVVNNFLFIYQAINTEGETAPNSRIIGKIPINFDIDIPNISAFFEENTLMVSLPFNNLKGGYRKKLTV